jgi:PAS domain S-box-containing protein
MQPKAYVPLANVMDLMLDAICVVDVDGRYLFVSAACERIFGYTPEEMLGRPMIELVYPPDRERTLAAAAEIMAGQPKPHFENRYVRKDGQVVHIMWSARWSEADQARIAVARDITEL